LRGALEKPAAATVARTANALDPATRTLLTEVDIPNASHAMMPGQFVNVSFQLKTGGQRWRIPATALVFNTQGTQVFTVGPDKKLHIQKVTVGRDFGGSVEIQSGLTGEESIVQQPDVSLQDGQVVTPAEPPNATKG
jgi:multidrug efflux pump subunit AcrA (membrane-fusion protein)